MQLTDPKGRMHQVVLQKGATFHTHRGSLSHDDLIGAPEGSVVIAAGGTGYVALRPLLADYTLAMKRGATIVYPKDAAQILAYADVFPGARVLEAGAGSGALSCWLLRAIGPDGHLVSFEARPDFAAGPTPCRHNAASKRGGLSQYCQPCSLSPYTKVQGRRPEMTGRFNPPPICKPMVNRRSFLCGRHGFPRQ